MFDKNVGKATKTGLASEAKAAQTYNISKGSVGKNIKGSAKLNDFSPSKLKRFVSKAGGVLTIAKALPTQIKVPAFLAALTAVGYTVAKDYKKWEDKRDGKTGNLPKSMMGTPTPKNTGGSGLKAKPNPLKKFTASRKAYGGKAMKMYAMGGGMRKAKTYG
jgi:hypothetical protein